MHEKVEMKITNQMSGKTNIPVSFDPNDLSSLNVDREPPMVSSPMDKYYHEDLPRMILNPDKEKVLKIINRIYKCEGHCPCQPNNGDDTKCPCVDFTKRHVCHCKLFVEEE